MATEKEKAAEEAKNKQLTEEREKGYINADDMTFKHDLPVDHFVGRDGKKGEETAPESVSGNESVSESGRSVEDPSELSYEEWYERIRNVADNDEAYQAAMARLAEINGSRPNYEGSYDDDILDAYNRILNREGFKYSLDDDSLYQQYADRYMAAGKLAMRDTMGQAASLTGGYGSSYGQAAGQQTYDAYLQGLGDIALQMYDRAYGRYKDEGDRLMDEYQLMRDMGDEEYGRYQDQLSQWNKDRSSAADAAGEAWNMAYKTEGEAYDRWWQQQEFEYEQQMDYASTLAKYGDFSGFAEIFGTDRAAHMQRVWIAGNFDVAYNSGMITADEYRAMTGKWPPGYKRTGGGYTQQKKDDGNRYDAVLTEVRIMDASGSTTGSIQGKIDQAYNTGAITQPQYNWLTNNFGSGNKNGNTGNSGTVNRPGSGPPALA